MSQTRIDELQACISSGEAFPAMSQDIQQARELNVRASPTLIFYEDRQHLTGNAGDRIMQANTRELHSSPTGQSQSWC